MEKFNTFIIGNGNLGSHLSELFELKGVSYTFLRRKSINTLQKGDFAWLCVPDGAIKPLIDQLIPLGVNLIYCSGALVLRESWSNSVGVWYPLYSFKKGFPIDWSLVPIFTETSSIELQQYFQQLHNQLELNYKELDSYGRRKHHLAAVFVNNFTNAILSAAEETMQEFSKKEISEALLPIALQTIDRWSDNSAKNMQTGPAARGDEETIEAHLSELLEFPEEKLLYQSLTKYITQKIQQKS